MRLDRERREMILFILKVLALMVTIAAVFGCSLFL